MTQEFLARLFGDDPAGHLYIWTIGQDGTKTTYWEPSIEALATRAAEQPQSSHVYFSLCGAQAPKDEHHRAEPADIVSMPFAWLDIDFAGPHHTKAGLPTVDQANTALAEFPFPPTVLVDSGSGYHAYWKFKEPTEFAEGLPGNADRITANALLRRLTLWFKSRLGNVDSTHDLSRVLRVPGTVNPRCGAVCTVLYMDGQEYNQEELEEFLESIDVAEDGDGPVKFGAGVSYAMPLVGDDWWLEGEATPRAPEKFDAHTRAVLDDLQNTRAYRDGLAKGFASDSERDAWAVRQYVNRCVNVQKMRPLRQVCYDMISLMRHMPDAQKRHKYQRIGYLEMTIGKIVAATRPFKAAAADSQQTTTPAPGNPAAARPAGGQAPAPSEPEDSLVARNLKAIQDSVTTRPIFEPVKLVGSDPQRYAFKTTRTDFDGSTVDVTVELEIDQLMDPRRFEKVWIAATNSTLFTMFTLATWRQAFVEKFIPICVPVAEATEATKAGMLRFHLERYLSQAMKFDDRNEAYKSESPFWDGLGAGRRLCYFPYKFAEYFALNGRGTDVASSCKLFKMMNTEGIANCKHMQFVVDGGNEARKRVYIAPSDIADIVRSRDKGTIFCDATTKSEDEKQWPKDDKDITQ